jgi:hypothetical protein
LLTSGVAFGNTAGKLPILTNGKMLLLCTPMPIITLYLINKRIEKFIKYNDQGKLVIVYYVIRSKNGVLCAANAHKIIVFLQTLITNYLRNVNKPGRKLGRLIN